MQSELFSGVFHALRSDREKSRLRDCEPCGRASSRVDCVPVGIERHDHIVPIVAASEKNAYQRLVARTLRQRLDQSETINARRERRDTQSATAGSLQKIST